MKIVHHYVNECFDWLISVQQSINPWREAISMLSGKYKRFTFVHPVTPKGTPKVVQSRSIEGLESSRPGESLKATKSRPHQVRISNPQKTSQPVDLCHYHIKLINGQIKNTHHNHNTISYLYYVSFSCFYMPFSWAVNSLHTVAAYDQDISNHRPYHFP